MKGEWSDSTIMALKDRALELALKFHDLRGTENTPESVVKTAEGFYKYLAMENEKT